MTNADQIKCPKCKSVSMLDECDDIGAEEDHVFCPDCNYEIDTAEHFIDGAAPPTYWRRTLTSCRPRPKPPASRDSLPVGASAANRPMTGQRVSPGLPRGFLTARISAAQFSHSPPSALSSGIVGEKHFQQFIGTPPLGQNVIRHHFAHSFDRMSNCQISTKIVPKACIHDSSCGILDG